MDNCTRMVRHAVPGLEFKRNEPARGKCSMEDYYCVVVTLTDVMQVNF